MSKREQVFERSEKNAVSKIKSEKNAASKTKDVSKTKSKTNFHIPYAWRNNSDMIYLATRKYLKNSRNGSIKCQDVKRIRSILKSLNYMDERKVIHEYTHHMIEDILYHNKNIYVTKNTIKNNSNIQTLVDNMVPNFIIKSTESRKTTLIHICSDNDSDEEIASIKNQYKKLDYFMDSYVFEPYNICIGLSHYNIMSEGDIEYLTCNINAFTTEYYNWLFAISSGRILLTDFGQDIHFLKFAKTNEYNKRNMKFKKALVCYYNNLKSNLLIAPTA
jgi:hypothetical protein